MSKTLEKLIKECEFKLKSGKPNYQNTVECDWLLRQLKVVKKEFFGQMIPISEDLPYENQQVLFYCKRYDVFGLGRFEKTVIVYNGSRYRIKDEVTSWMPMPCTTDVK